ncbi:MAG: NlpC/P60 family protein [Candidatus Nanopelagicales bacterium]
MRAGRGRLRRPLVGALAAGAVLAAVLPAQAVPSRSGAAGATSTPAGAGGRSGAGASAAVAVAAAAPTDIEDARARAAALRERLDDLEARRELAIEDAAAARDALARAISGELAGARQVDAVARVEADARARMTSTVRALYMGGGMPALYATVLDGQDLGDAVDRVRLATSLVTGGLTRIEAAESELAAARAVQAELAADTTDRLQLAQRAAAAESTVRRLSAELRTALAGADAQVRRLLEEERARAEQEAREAAARALAAARAASPWTTPAEVPADQRLALDRALAEATAAPASPYAVAVLADARRWLGVPYSAGGGSTSGPTRGFCDAGWDDGRLGGACLAQVTVGFDCSGLMLRIFAAAGYALPRVSRQQFFAGDRVPMAYAAPGDMLFWAYDLSNPATIHHVALYLGHGLMLHSPHTGDHVRVAPVYTDGLVGAVRPSFR